MYLKIFNKLIRFTSRSTRKLIVLAYLFALFSSIVDMVFVFVAGSFVAEILDAPRTELSLLSFDIGNYTFLVLLTVITFLSQAINNFISIYVPLILGADIGRKWFDSVAIDGGGMDLSVSEVVTRGNQDLRRCVGQIFVPFLQASTRSIQVLLISGLLFMSLGMNFIIVLGICVVLFFGAFWLTRGWMKKIGLLITMSDREINKSLFDFSSAYAQILHTHGPNWLADRYERAYQSLGVYQAWGQSVASAPRALIEMTVFLFVFAALQSEGFEPATMALLGVGLVRILPGIQVIQSAFSKFHMNRESLNHLIPRIIEAGSADTEIRASAYRNLGRIRIENISTMHSKPVSVELKPGDWVGVYGRSGVGKSSFAKALRGLLPTMDGRISLDIDGSEVVVERRRQLGCVFGLVPQDVKLIEGSVAENIWFKSDLLESERNQMHALLAKLELDNWILRLEDGVDTQISKVGELISGGQKQRLGILRELVREIPVVILDETLSGLDKDLRTRLLERLKLEFPSTIWMVITHQTEIIDQFDHIIEM